MEHNTLQNIKLIVTGLFALVTARLGALAAPLYILVLLNMMDYATGFVAAPYRGEKRSSAVGFRGIAKKVCMWLLVALGGVLDWLVAYAMETVGRRQAFHRGVRAAHGRHRLDGQDVNTRNHGFRRHTRRARPKGGDVGNGFTAYHNGIVQETCGDGP